MAADSHVHKVLQSFHTPLTALFLLLLTIPTPQVCGRVEQLRPTVLIAVPVRNKAHSLPYFLSYMEKLDYPKKRISLWFRSDHNSDNSSAQVEAWLDHVRPLYHSAEFEFVDSETQHADQEGALHWSRERFTHVMQLRQAALDAARRMWADYVLMIDADVILKNPKTLKLLVEQDKTIVAPLMNITASENYANFWGAMDEEGYYKRSEDYFEIKEQRKKGCFEVAMVHSVVLINMRHGISERLAYYPPPQYYDGPYDDIIVFAHSAKFNGVKMHILNTEFFGYLPLPMEAHNSVAEEAEQFIHLKTESIIDDKPLDRVDYLYPPPLVKQKDKLGFDQVYMINLKRRPDRYEKMVACFEELGIKFKYVEAVDGKLLNNSYLESLNVRMLPGYSDPYHGRPLTKGEIGCFLSHYFIWLDIIENNYQKVVVFEDDIRFQPYFRKKLEYVMQEARQVRLDWDLIYMGRRRMRPKKEKYVRNTQKFVHVDYSVWALGYLLSHQGAKKLLAAEPLDQLLPVDEFLSILNDKSFNYLGRKKLRWQDESFVDGTKYLVYPNYSYWTLSYLLTRSGVNKLLRHNPLTRLLPIDEYIPILFDKHLEDDWKLQFEPRNLNSFSVEPLLVFPTHYTGEPGYITDTDESDILNFGSDGRLSKSPYKSPHKSAKQVKSGTVDDVTPSNTQRGDVEDLPKNDKDEL